MPIYEYTCKECGSLRDEWVESLSYTQVSCECGQEMTRVVSDLRVNFKGWDWPTKNENEGVYRKKENNLLREKAKERPVDRALPNVNGERVESWSEAQKLAKEKGYATSTYEPLIREEKKT